MSFDLDAVYSHVTEQVFREYNETAVIARVHHILSKGNQLSLDTKLLKDGNVVTQRLSFVHLQRNSQKTAEWVIIANWHCRKKCKPGCLNFRSQGVHFKK
jgi:ABC-type phosphate transport system ATPase subunit